MPATFADITDAEKLELVRIAKRAVEWDRRLGETRTSALDVTMTVLAVHASCPLDLARLAGFTDADFCHDIGLMRRHLDQATGELPDWFAPRCARVHS